MVESVLTRRGDSDASTTTTVVAAAVAPAVVSSGGRRRRVYGLGTYGIGVSAEASALHDDYPFDDSECKSRSTGKVLDYECN